MYLKICLKVKVIRGTVLLAPCNPFGISCHHHHHAPPKAVKEVTFWKFEGLKATKMAFFPRDSKANWIEICTHTFRFLLCWNARVVALLMCGVQLRNAKENSFWITRFPWRDARVNTLIHSGWWLCSDDCDPSQFSLSLLFAAIIEGISAYSSSVAIICVCLMFPLFNFTS